MSTLYREPYRPQFHFSPPAFWLNDPNGLVYHKGFFHLFYQHHPFSTQWGPMHWGHAISPDLVHWQHLPIALYPDAIAAIFSGGVVFDADNTSGLVPGGGLIAVFSYANQTQGLAFSRDDGLTWEKYSGNPVMPAHGEHFRDPHVFWHTPTRRWVMSLAVADCVHFYTSPNLRHWEFAGAFSAGHVAGLWEVPSLLPFEVEGKTVWVLLVSVLKAGPAGSGGLQYFIGDFDGHLFSNHHPPDTVLWADFGPDNYAAVTFHNAPHNRHILLGWMNNWEYANALPTRPWNGSMTLPRLLRLEKTPAGLRLCQTPYPEFRKLRHPLLITTTHTVPAGDNALAGLRGKTIELVLELFHPQDFTLVVHQGAVYHTRLTYDAARGTIEVDRTRCGDTAFHPAFARLFSAPLPAGAGLKLHLFLDESCLELFGAEGQTVITALLLSAPEDAGLELTAPQPLAIRHLEVYALHSIWGAPHSPHATAL